MNNLHAQNFRLNSTRMRVSSKILSNNNDNRRVPTTKSTMHLSTQNHSRIYEWQDLADIATHLGIKSKTASFGHEQALSSYTGENVN